MGVGTRLGSASGGPLFSVGCLPVPIVLPPPRPPLQEPVAAARACGFQAMDSKAMGLGYDFGGGTFDAAVVAVKDGTLRVVNHAGDDFFGGKHVDREIVDSLLVLDLSKARSLAGFSRANPHWRAARAKLKYHPEEAKIQVSRTGRAQGIYLEGLCADDRGDPVDFEHEIRSVLFQLHALLPAAERSESPPVGCFGGTVLPE